MLIVLAYIKMLDTCAVLKYSHKQFHTIVFR
jgi:hypothetical protein